MAALWAAIVGSAGVSGVFRSKRDASAAARLHASMALSNVEGDMSAADFRKIDQNVVVEQREGEEAASGAVDPIIAATRVLAFATKAAAASRTRLQAGPGLAIPRESCSSSLTRRSRISEHGRGASAGMGAETAGEDAPLDREGRRHSTGGGHS